MSEITKETGGSDGGTKIAELLMDGLKIWDIAVVEVALPVGGDDSLNRHITYVAVGPSTNQCFLFFFYYIRAIQLEFCLFDSHFLSR